MSLTNTQEDQINELNSQVKVRIGVSKTEGVGVIAITDIRKGDRCYCVPLLEKVRWYKLSWGSLGKLFPHVEKLIKDQWPSIVNGSMFPSPNYTAWPILFINHSDDPNYDNRTDTALRDIPAGTELTEDYCSMVNAKIAFPWLKCDIIKEDKNNLDSSVGSGEGVVAHLNQPKSRQPLWLFKKVIHRFIQKNQKEK